jgi:hypothetical protein
MTYSKNQLYCDAFFFNLLASFLTRFSIPASFVSICPMSFDIFFRVSFPLITFVILLLPYLGLVLFLFLIV